MYPSLSHVSRLQNSNFHSYAGSFPVINISFVYLISMYKVKNMYNKKPA